jgi:hypothetical protein
MSINWFEMQKVLYPIKNYETLRQDLRRSFAFSVIRQAYNFPLPDLINYTTLLLGGDERGRYDEWLSILIDTLSELNQAGLKDIESLLNAVDGRERLENFICERSLDAPGLMGLMKYLYYWVIPTEKYLNSLVRDDLSAGDAIAALRKCEIRTNLELLREGVTPPGRSALAQAAGLSIEDVTALVNRADYSRMPFASKATISNIIGAGYCSLSDLAQADCQKLETDFFNYGKSIGKNLKLGNEIGNSYRIAKIIPKIIIS